MINVYTIACNRPDFIEIQLDSLRRYLTDEFEYTVFNNAADLENESAIEQKCSHLGIHLSNVGLDRQLLNHCQALENQVDRQGGPNIPIFKPDGSYSNANIACAYSLSWAWKHFISKSTRPILLLDSDMFLIKPFNAERHLQPRYNELCFVPMHRPGVTYMWNALVLADIPNLPAPETIDWYCGQVRGHSVDCGGQTDHYLRKYPLVGWKIIDTKRIDDEKQTGHELLWRGRFLHYLRGSNWNNQTEDFHREKLAMLRERYDF